MFEWAYSVCAIGPKINWSLGIAAKSEVGSEDTKASAAVCIQYSHHTARKLVQPWQKCKCNVSMRGERVYKSITSVSFFFIGILARTNRGLIRPQSNIKDQFTPHANTSVL